MAQIVIEVSDAQVTRVLAAFARQYSYQDEINDPINPGKKIPNPMTKAQFARKVVTRFAKEVVMTAEANEAAEVARKAKLAEVNIDFKDME